MRILDTHLHLIYQDRFRYTWLDGLPDLNRQWDAPSYWVEAEKLGIEAALHMEAGGAEPKGEDETDFVLHVHPKVIGAIAFATPETTDFPRQLERLAALDRVHGVRRVLQGDPDGLSQSEVFRANIRRLPKYHLTFDICMQARQLPVARELVAACPDVQFILDHCGNPLIDHGDIGEWRRDIAALAKLPNVAGKISGIINHAPRGWTTETLRPAIEHMIERFGWDRVVWGSDRPVLVPNGGLTRWVETVKAVVAGASQDEQAGLFRRNAERIYGV